MEDRKQNLVKLKNIAISALIFLIIVSCNSMKTSAELKNNFTNGQIKDLNKINNFFISEYLHSNLSNYGKSFKKIYEFSYYNGIDTIIGQVNFEKQKKLYNSISKSTFDEIWEVKKNTDVEFYSTEHILPKYKGKFQSYLKYLSQTNALAKDCWKHMETSGDFYYLMLFNYISKNFNTIDFEDINNQIIISIYYLSMIDDNERDENLKKRRLELQKKVQKQLIN